MPRHAMLPTPASSTEIKGQDSTKQLSSLQMSFELPPSAMEASSGGSASSPKAPFPMQPSETVKSRRRSSAAATAHKETFALPPPPTRSRKIIQMKPRGQREETPAESTSTTTTTTSSSSSSSAKAHASSNNTAQSTTTNKNAAGSGSGSGSKKKQPSATSAAGRKIARKTAHSLIERRRRSKMNEEFAVLKGLIPACTGEMHKLAILQVRTNLTIFLSVDEKNVPIST